MSVNPFFLLAKNQTNETPKKRRENILLQIPFFTKFHSIVFCDLSSKFCKETLNPKQNFALCGSVNGGCLICCNGA
jgi:hypothetical protein